MTQKYDVIGEKTKLIEKYEPDGDGKPVFVIKTIGTEIIREKTTMETAVRLHKEMERSNFHVLVFKHPEGVKRVMEFHQRLRK